MTGYWLSGSALRIVIQQLTPAHLAILLYQVTKLIYHFQSLEWLFETRNSVLVEV